MRDRNAIETAHLLIITDKDAFLDNLIWLGMPDYWNESVAGELYRMLAPGGIPPSLRKAAERLIRKYGKDSTMIFQKLSEASNRQPKRGGRRSKFFTSFPKLNENFDLSCMGPLLVSSLREWHDHDNGDPARRKDKLYIDDGNHRALVYATRVMCGDNRFAYMPVLWSKSWEWLLGHGADADTSSLNFPPRHDGWKYVKEFDPAKHDFIKTHRIKQKK